MFYLTTCKTWIISTPERFTVFFEEVTPLRTYKISAFSHRVPTDSQAVATGFWKDSHPQLCWDNSSNPPVSYQLSWQSTCSFCIPIYASHSPKKILSSCSPWPSSLLCLLSSLAPLLWALAAQVFQFNVLLGRTLGFAGPVYLELKLCCPLLDLICDKYLFNGWKFPLHTFAGCKERMWFSVIVWWGGLQFLKRLTTASVTMLQWVYTVKLDLFSGEGGSGSQGWEWTWEVWEVSVIGVHSVKFPNYQKQVLCWKKSLNIICIGRCSITMDKITDKQL